MKLLLQKAKASFCAFFETRVRYLKVSKVQGKFGNMWQLENNYDFSLRGRIWFGWKPGEIQVDIVRKTKQFIGVQIPMVNTHFLLLAVYGLHTIADKKNCGEICRHC